MANVIYVWPPQTAGMIGHARVKTYCEFSTKYAAGQSILTNNSPDIGSFAKLPTRDILRVKEPDIQRLYRVHCYREAKLGEANALRYVPAPGAEQTSLLEGLTWGYYSARSIQQKFESTAPPHSSRAGIGSLPRALLKSIPDWRAAGSENLEDPALILQDWTTIQHTMWNYVGIVRSYERLKRAVADMNALGNRLTKYYHESGISKAIVELFHGQQMSAIVADSALRNPQSRGAHFRKD